MKKLDESLLDSVGLSSLAAEEKERMLTEAAAHLQTRVGIRLAEEATREQLEAFETLTQQGETEKVAEWLEATFPNYPQIYEEEFQELQNDFAEIAQKIQQ